MSTSWRELAESRVNASERLSKYSDLLIEYDWNESEHDKWVATAPESEIIRWCEVIREQERQAKEQL